MSKRCIYATYKNYEALSRHDTVVGALILKLQWKRKTSKCVELLEGPMQALIMTAPIFKISTLVSYLLLHTSGCGNSRLEIYLIEFLPIVLHCNVMQGCPTFTRKSATYPRREMLGRTIVQAGHVTVQPTTRLALPTA